ncbi:MAG: hypothetical protein LBK46_05380, partial [Oscillospiraceae bacterium]|nr:hypothetical protein [Oscillospiraceae bacterium]
MAAAHRGYPDTYTRSYPTAISPRNKTKRGRRRHPFGRFILILLAALIVLGAAGAIAANHILQPFSDRFHEGVFVDGTPLAGMTPQEAYEAISINASERLNQWSMTLTYHDGADGGDTWTLTPDTLEMQIDTADQVNSAYMQGRQGTLFTRLLDIWTLRSTPYQGYTTF